MIHDTWATRPGSVPVTLRGSRAAHELTVAVTTALGPGWALLEDQLRQELGHDISAGLGR